MADSEKIDGPTTVTFNVEEQQNHQELNTSMTFSKYVHAALAEKIDRDRMTRDLAMRQQRMIDADGSKPRNA